MHTYDLHAPLFPLTVDGKSFVEASPWQRFFVIAAGALMNFVLGFILLLVLVASGSAVTSTSRVKTQKARHLACR